MNAPQQSSPLPASKVSRRRLFRTVMVLFWVLAGVMAAELLLRYKDQHIRQADKMDPGFLQYDDRLGWTLTPNWSGEHKNHDFSVRYRIDETGFRAEVLPSVDTSSPSVAIVGDSFTFGLGVNDDQPFVHLLNEKRLGGRRFSNWGIPGMSTDQQSLLIERQLSQHQPEQVILVLYLGNDLIDNLLTIPTQLNLGKPRYIVQSDQLVLTNVPVPQDISQDLRSRPTLASAILGEKYLANSLRYRWGQRSALFQYISEALLPAPSLTENIYKRTDASIDLCLQILDKVATDCSHANARFTVAIVGGKSFVEDPQSISSQYQDYCHTRLIAGAKERKWDVNDLALAMRTLYQAKPEHWYYPSDGHLTPEGHRKVSELIAGSTNSIRRYSGQSPSPECQ